MKKNVNNYFNQFSTQQKSGTIKEAYRQQKRKIKQEINEAREEKKMIRNKNKELLTNTTSKYNHTEKKLIKNEVPTNQIFPLNKFIAHCGICGRREAATLVKSGLVSVNNIKIEDPGFKVNPTDKVFYKNQPIHLKQHLVYILLNKPKDYITTLHDTHSRKTVLDLIKGATPYRVFPVGRLDRNTTGVLLFTNDGELTQKLTHPSFEVKKIYEVTLDKPVTKKDLESIANGIELEDGFIQADSISFVDANKKNIVGIEIHSGKNRIVRRIFEKLGYDVKYLDRVLFANLTKKNVDRGKWRFLTEKEILSMKFLNTSFLRKSKNNHV